MMTDCGELTFFLGMKFSRVGESLTITQGEKVKKILSKFGMDNCKEAQTPMEKNLSLGRATNKIEKPYRLMYLMVCCRPDICYSVGNLSRLDFS